MKTAIEQQKAVSAHATGKVMLASSYVNATRGRTIWTPIAVKLMKGSKYTPWRG